MGFPHSRVHGTGEKGCLSDTALWAVTWHGGDPCEDAEVHLDADSGGPRYLESPHLLLAPQAHSKPLCESVTEGLMPALVGTSGACGGLV